MRRGPILLVGTRRQAIFCSTRTGSWRHLYDALARCAHHLTKFGGHKHAAGVTLERDPHADDGRLDGGELARETGNVLGRNAGHLLDIVGRELRGAGGKLGEEPA